MALETDGYTFKADGETVQIDLHAVRIKCDREDINVGTTKVRFGDAAVLRKTFLPTWLINQLEQYET